VGNVSPHLNAGYTYTSRGGLAGASLHSEWNYAAGVDVAVSPRLTLIADVLGRTIRDQGRLKEADVIFDFVEAGPGGTGGTGGGGGGGGGGSGGSGGTPNRPVEHVTKRQFRLEPGNLNLVVGTTGVRFNPYRKMLVSANLLFALTNAGLRDRVTPVISLDYSF
jgi:hypothetical protein